jgi:hypothetical protein
VEPRAGLDDLERRKFLTIPGLELRNLGGPASSYTDYAIPTPRHDERQIINKYSREESVNKGTDLSQISNIYVELIIVDLVMFNKHSTEATRLRTSDFQGTNNR